MATINFLYRSNKKKGDLTLRLLYRYMGSDYTLGVNSRISVEQEFFKKQLNQKKLKDINLINEQSRVKNLMNDLSVHIIEKLNKVDTSGLNKEWLELQVEQFYNPVELKPKVPIYLTEYFDYYVELLITNRNTKKKLITTQKKILKYEDSLKRKILIETIDNVELNNFKKHLTKLCYNQNTILVDFTNIKTICRHAKTALSVNEEIFNWSLKKERISIVYLNFDEINKIIEINDLVNYLDNSRDWLIISCYTGQRVSDFMSFTKSMIRIEKDNKGKEITFIEFTQKKTKQNIALPLHPEVIKILKKRNGEFPRPISDVKYNKYIKIIVKKAGITEEIIGSKIDKDINRKVKKAYPKYELITSHIGRRSFATNFYGVIPTPLIMSATGHMSEKMFLNYIGKSQTDRAKSLADYF